MMATRRHLRYSGFSLIEILVSIAVLAVALAALANFQLGLLRGGSEAKARTVAASLAKEKLEDLRSFSELSDLSDRDDASSHVDGEFGYNEIVSAPVSTTDVSLGGGAEAAGTGNLTFPAGTNVVTVGNVQYSRAWTVTENTNSKDVVVTISWTDQAGTAQSVSLAGNISASSPAAAARAAKPPPPQESPLVKKTPGAAPDVISIPLKFQLGDGLTKESSKPEPDVIAQAGTTIVYFDEVVYDTSLVDADGDSPIVNRDEFLTVNCVCVQGDAAGSSISGNAFEPAVLEPVGHSYSVGSDNGDGIITDDDKVSKRIGHAATGNEQVYNPDTASNENLNLSKQPVLCTACCRDHHDKAGHDYVDPFRSHDSGIDGDHNHFFPDSSGNLVAADTIGDLYLEACRFVRVDGEWRVTQDWRLESLHVLPGPELTDDGGAGTTALNHYKDYARKFVIDYVDAVISNSTSYTAWTPVYYPQTGTTTASDDFTSSFDSELADLRNSEDTGDEYALGNTGAASNTAAKTLLARAIYMDYMDSDLIELLRCKSDDSVTRPSGCEDVAYDDSYLALVPFHEVNLTGLANWSWTGSAINVSDEPITNDNRGLIDTVAVGCSDAVVNVERSNTGLTDTMVLDNISLANDAEDTALLNDAITVAVGGASCGGSPPAPTNVTVGGDLSISNNAAGGLTLSDIQITGINGATNCQTDAANATWQCELDADGDGQIQISNYTGRDEFGACDQDNKISPSADVVADDAYLNETSSFYFVGEAADVTLDISISKDGSGHCA